MSKPTVIHKHAFGGSLCCIREFQTTYGIRCCLTIFSLSDYKILHFPHYEYKCIINTIFTHLSTETKINNPNDSDVQVFTIKQLPFGELKIKIGEYTLKVGPVSAFGLLKHTPLSDFDSFTDKSATNWNVCDSKWDICICKTCPVFKRLIEYEARARQITRQSKPQNVLFNHDFE